MLKKHIKKFSAIIASLSVLFVAGCGDSPEDVAQKYIDALVKGDLAAMNEVSTAKTAQLNGFLIAAMENDPKKEQKKKELEAELSNISKVEINGDSADVYFGDGKPITLKKVDGEWKVDVKKN